MNADLTPGKELDRLARTRRTLEDVYAIEDDPRTQELLLEGLKANGRRRRDLEAQIEKEKQ